MDDDWKRKIGPFVGVGLMIMWGSGIAFFAGLSDEATSFVGGCLVSASGLAVFLYVGRLENEIRELTKRRNY